MQVKALPKLILSLLLTHSSAALAEIQAGPGSDDVAPTIQIAPIREPHIDAKFKCEKIKIPTTQEMTSLNSTFPPDILNMKQKEILAVQYEINLEIDKTSELRTGRPRSEEEDIYVRLLRMHRQNCVSKVQRLEATRNESIGY